MPEGAKTRLGKGRLIHIKLSPGLTRVAVPTSIGIWIYDAQTGEVVPLFTETQTGEKDAPMFTGPKGPPEALNFPTDAGIIASAHGNSIHVWDTSTGNTLATVDEHPGSINALVLSPDSITLATASGDGRKVRLWDVLTQATTSAA